MVLLAAAALGCTGSNSPPDDAPGPAPPGGEAPGAFSHIISAETPYYQTGPQQGRPPEGTLAAGTKVQILEEAGSYTRVRTEDGIEAYVASDTLQPAEPPTVDVSTIVEGGNQFAVDLYQQLRAEPGNLFFSPSSISTALAMTRAGADGQTAVEMASTLHWEMPGQDLHAGMKMLQAQLLGETPGIRLHAANRLWGAEDFSFLAEFLDITRLNYGAQLERLDFERRTEESRQTINTWVAEQTEDKITDLLPVGVLSPDSKLVLTNAVYFNGDWSVPFDEKQTKDEDFRLPDGETVKVPLMHKRDKFRYCSADGLQLLELPYGKGDLSMIVLLSEQVAGLADLEAALSWDNLQKWTAQLQTQEVIVFLPRFKTTSQFGLNDTLRSLGMVTAFDAATADFSGMTGNRDLFISAVVHKAFVDVNEKGTEAAAATGVVMGRTSAPVEPEKPPVFRADHPFVFMIRDNRSGAILFMGRLVSPLT